MRTVLTSVVKMKKAVELPITMTERMTVMLIVTTGEKLVQENLKVSMR